MTENYTKGVKPPVLLQHGIEADMFWWTINEADIAPALVLARAGYDVWMGNNRGTRWSLGHVNLTSSEKAFWQFDWEDMGLYDTPKVLDYITLLTGHEKVNYVGHSEGTT